jgi:dienelactone hydrolase
MRRIILFTTIASCTIIEEQPISLRPCDPTLGTSSDSGSSTTDNTTTATNGDSSSTGNTFDCPNIVDGTVVFDLGDVQRSAYFDGVAEATGLGPVTIGLHGTFEDAISGGVPVWLGYNPGSDMLSMTTSQHGVFAALIGDAAAQADGEPFPWWHVCGDLGTQCTRDDDDRLATAVVACAIEQGLADPARVLVGGMSAGGIQTSLLVESGVGEHVIAGAVSWSGGQPAMFQPTVPDSTATSVFVLHGGPTDVYPQGCNPAVPPCHSFAPDSELMASQLDDAGSFSFVCNHQGGHNAQMGPQGAEFLSVARSDAAHPWIGFPFGVDGYAQWPQMSGGTNWMLRFYGDCHAPM